MNKNKRIIIGCVVAIIVVVGGLTIYNGAGTNKVKKSITSTLIPNIKDFYKVSQTVKINDISMTIDKIKISNGIKSDRPEEGKEYLIVTVTVKNGGKSKIHYDDGDFQMQDSKGEVNNCVTTTIDEDQTFKGGELAPNREVTGTITFLSVKDAKGLSLNYNGDIFGHTIVHFKLN